MEFLGFGVLVIGAALIGLVLFAFWIWMLIEVATKETSEGDHKLVWLLIVLFGGGLGAILYFFVRRPQRITQTGQ